MAASEARARRVLETLADPWALLDAMRDARGRIVDFVIVDANDAACQATRTTREELLGGRLLDLLPVRDDSGFLDRCREVVETGRPLAMADVVATNRRDGAEHHHDIRAVRIDDGISLTWSDVTARHAAEQAMAEREEHFRLLAENASDVVVQLAVDGSVLWVSPSVQTTLGWTPQEFQSRSIRDLMHPDDFRRVLATQQEIVARGGSEGRAEARYATPDGRWRWMSIVGRVVRDEHGRILGAVDSLRDTHAEVEAREAVTRSERRLRAAMASAPVGMAVVSLDGRFLDVNPALCAMLGHDRQWFQEHETAEIIHPDDLALDHQTHHQVESGAVESARQVVRLLTADGRVLWVDHAVGALRDDDGTAPAFVAHFVDITQEHRAHEHLRFQATHDDLTSLVNRRELTSRMDLFLSQQPRLDARLGVLFIDIDRLKAVNDTLGHAVGDHLLVQTANRISSQVRADDVVARVGGDEFVVLLPGIRAQADAERIATKIQAAITRPSPTTTPSCTPLPASASRWPDPGRTWTTSCATPTPPSTPPRPPGETASPCTPADRPRRTRRRRGPSLGHVTVVGDRHAQDPVGRVGPTAADSEAHDRGGEKHGRHGGPDPTSAPGRRRALHGPQCCPDCAARSGEVT